MSKIKKSLGYILLVVVVIFIVGYFAISSVKLEQGQKQETSKLSRSEKLEILKSIATTTPFTSMSLKEKKKILEEVGKQSTTSYNLSVKEKMDILNSLTN